MDEGRDGDERDGRRERWKRMEEERWTKGESDEEMEEGRWKKRKMKGDEGR